MARRRSSYYNYYSYYRPSRTIETEEGIRARSKRGAFAKNWWASRWIEAMERLMDSGRLSRGRTYARKGQVLSIDEIGERVEARVQGSRPRPYQVTIQVTPLTDTEWDRVIDSLVEQALYTAQLLAGEMPAGIDEAFDAAGVSLFPARGSDLVTDCSCPDWANPCKHIAATHYILGERFDEDPFLLFRLRGRSQGQILEALRQRRVSGESAEDTEEEAEAVIPLDDLLDSFWEFGAPPDEFSIAIRPPAIEMPLLKRLGEASFVPDPGLQILLKPAFLAISEAALTMAYKEDAIEE